MKYLSIPILSTLFLLFACSPKSADQVQIKNAFMFEPLSGQKMTAGYFTLTNEGVLLVALDRVKIDGVQRVELHNMENIDGMIQMRPVKEMTILAHGELVLRQGGKHLMIFGAEELQAGQLRDMTLYFKNGTVLETQIAVRDRS